MQTKKQRKIWAEKNRKRLAQIQSNYYYRNREKILEKMKNNKEYRNRQRARVKLERKNKPWLQHLWSANTRCNNKNNKQYKNYGGRGIKCFLNREDIKKLWFRDKAYLMKKPSIDRIDNNWHYTFDNCRFIELTDNIKKMNKERHQNHQCLDYCL